MKRLGVWMLLLAAPCAAQIPGFTSAPVNFAGVASAQAVDPSGDVWIMDPVNSVLGRLELPSGNYTTYPVPTDNSPGLYNLAVTPDGAVWYTDYAHPLIGRRSPDGTISRFTVSAAPYLIAASHDNGVFFSTIAGNAIGYLAVTPRVSTRTFSSPSAITVSCLAVGPDGAAYFADFQNHRIGRVDSDGTFTFYPVPKPNTTLAYYPSITAGPDGNVWFTHGPYIGRLRLSDGVITEFTIPYANADAGGISAGTDGNIWFADSAAGAGVVSQLIVSTAADDGTATINPSPGIGEPIGIVAASPAHPPAPAAHSPELATDCPPVAFIVEQNVANGPNLTYITATVTSSGNCADLQWLPNAAVLSSDSRQMTLTFNIFNNGPATAAKPTLLLSKINGLYSMTVTSMANWSCAPADATSITCTRNSDMPPGTFDSAYALVVLATGNTIPASIELESEVFSSTPDPYPGNNWFNLRYATASNRASVNLHEIGGQIIRVLPGRP